jgi:phage tail-like protein
MSFADPPRFALIEGAAAWLRAAFDANVALVDGVVQLAWDTRGEGGTALPVPDQAGAGLAFDTHCRLYHSVPGEHRVERWLWDAYDPGRPQDAPPAADVLLDRPPQPQVFGALPPDAGSAFAPVGTLAPVFTPRALACDTQEHLYVLDTQAHCIRVLDLQQRRVLRAEPVPADTADIAWFGAWLWVLGAGGTVSRMSAASSLRAVPVSVTVAAPGPASRLDFAEDGRLFVLQAAHTAGAAVFELGRPGQWHATPQALSFAGDNPFAFASDIAVSGCGEHQFLVLARRREEVFSRVDLDGPPPYALAEPLTARHYDGLGIAATPDGRVAFWTAKGARHATAARLHYRSPGRVVGFRLDAGQSLGGAQPSWGRLFFDACLPPGTQLRVQCIVGDDDLDAARLARTPPANQPLPAIAQPAATPLPLLAMLPAADAPGGAVFQRTDGSEQPWLVETERYDTFEAVAPALPGRYLWLIIDLIGHSRASPRLRSVRAESPAHDWLRRLPQLYSRQDAMRQFMQRLLAPLAGLHDDLAAQSDQRQALLKPCSTPAAALPWLANWMGLVLDERWSDTARRSFVKEAPMLFRLRGTSWALRRMVEIVTGAPVVIVEQYRLRGLGRLGPDPTGQGWDGPAVLGMGLRVGGPLGNAEVVGQAADIADSFALNAHRFTLLVQAELDAETEAAVRHLLDVHRPAHTLYTLCGLGQGARVGRGLQIGLTTLVGKSGGFTPLQLGAGTLGRGQVLGRPASGLRPGSAVIGGSARLG